MGTSNKRIGHADVSFTGALGVLEDAADGFIACDSGLRIIYLNCVAERLYGESKAELLGRIPWEVSSVLGGSEFAIECRRVLAERVPGTLECYHRYLACWLELRVLPAAGGGVSIWLRNITERKRTEEALRQSEEKYRSIVLNIPDVVWAADSRGHVVFVSPNVESLSGYTAEDLHQGGLELFFQTVHPDDLQAMKETLQAAFRDHQPREVEYRGRRKDGRWIWVRVRAIGAYEKDGILYLQGLISDITDRKRAEEALRESEQRYRVLFELAGDAIFLVRNDHFVDFNQKALELLGCGREQVIGKTPSSFSPPQQPDGSDSPEAGLKRRRLALEGQTLHFEWQHLRFDGTPFEAEVTLSRLEIAGEAHHLALVRDVTERKRAEERLRKLSLAVEQSPATVVITDVQGKIEYVNPKFTQLTGYTLEEVIGQNPRILKSGMVSAATYRELWETVLSGGEWRGEFSNRKKNGEIYWESASIVPIRDASGAITHFLGVKEDITERKRAEETLRESEEGLAAAQRIAHIGSWHWDVQANTARWSDETFRIFGLTPGKLEDHRQVFLELVHPADRMRVDRALSEALDGTRDYDLDYRIQRPDWTEKVIHAQAEVLKDEAGKPLALRGINYDITERKRAEEALQESETRYRAFIANSSEGIWRYEGVEPVLTTLPLEEQVEKIFRSAFLAECNDAVARMYGFERREELVGRQLASLMTSDPRNLELLRAFVRSGYRLDNAESFGLDRQGNVRHFENSFVGVVEDGYLVRAWGVQRDITERKRAEEKLRLTQFSLEHASDGVFWMNPHGRIVYANEAACRSLGCSREELLSLTIPDIDPLFTQEIWESFWKETKARGSITFESEHRTKQGRVFPVEITGNYLEFDGKEYSFAFARDIAERKQAAKALRDSEYWLKESQRISQMGSWVLDVATGIFSTISESLGGILGIGPDYPRTIEGWKALVHPEQREEMMDYLTNEVLGQSKPFDREYRIVRPSDGRVRWVYGHAKLICDATGMPTVLAGTTQDITARKAVEEELRQAQKLEGLGRLAGGVAHDFNNVLTVINGYSALLLRELKDGDPLRESVAEIHKAGEQAANLTRQLLMFSRKQITEPRPLDLNQLIDDNLGMLQRLVGEDITVETRLAPSLGTVLADPGQLHQVLLNLASNARDAMPRGGSLTLTTSNADVKEGDSAPPPGIAPGCYVLLSVADTGTGIEAEAREHIFEPFFTTKGAGEGTGLGLSTVYGIVQQAGGSISFQSEPGCGATFRIYLPRTEARVPSRPKTAQATLDHGGTETVLVVEDQDSVRKLAVRILKGRSYRILEAAQGEEALLLAESYSNPIHLLLTDVVMPGMTGPELAHRLKQTRPAMQVLYMSAFAAHVISSRGLLDPGELHIAKPFDPEEMVVKVREALGCAPAPAAGRVLVVDDEKQVRSLFQKVLADAGYKVQIAKDGNQGLKMARAQRFDLVVVDLVMPEREGIEIIQILRKQQRDLKIIAVSGAFGGGFLKVAELLGANATLAKPVDPDQLITEVRDLLG